MFQVSESRRRVVFCFRRDWFSDTCAPLLILSHHDTPSSHNSAETHILSHRLLHSAHSIIYNCLHTCITWRISTSLVTQDNSFFLNLKIRKILYYVSELYWEVIVSQFSCVLSEDADFSKTTAARHHSILPSGCLLGDHCSAHTHFAAERRLPMWNLWE